MLYYLEPQVKNFLFEDIFQILKGLVNVEKSVQVNCYTPYHHKIGKIYILVNFKEIRYI